MLEISMMLKELQFLVYDWETSESLLLMVIVLIML